MKGWGDLGVVETIFEEDNEDSQSFSSPPLSPPLSSCSSPLQSAVDEWTEATGKKPDVKIHVEGICFHLHKDLLISKSSYLKRKLIGVSEFTLAPPLKITADTFKQVADFCYTGEAAITPLNVAALRTAVELLRMDDDNGNGNGNGDDVDSLRQRTESYFGVVVALNKDLACNVFHSCLSLLPEAEQMASLASRCLEALFLLDDGEDDDGEGDDIVGCADGLKTVSPEDLRVIADSMHRRLTDSHDLLYRVVDLYFLVYNGKISEDQKTQICNCIDCSILSPHLLMHAVQNPRMPLRFIVQAMLIEQLNTHRSIFSALNTANTTTTAPATRTRALQSVRSSEESPATLGAILERDAALRQVAQLRATIDTTSSRIESLERELTGMKQLLAEKDKEKEKEKEKSLIVFEQQAGRSSSCRFSVRNKVERGERGSVSSSMLRFGDSCSRTDQVQNPKVVKRVSFGQRLIRGLKTAFGGSKLMNKNSGKFNGSGKDERKEVIIGDDQINGVSTMLDFEDFQSGNNAPHHRSRSVS